MSNYRRINTHFIIACAIILFGFQTPSRAADWQYSFRPGDTLWSVCQQYTNEPNCWLKLGPLNDIDANRRIAPGTRINIPASWLKVPAATVRIVYVKGDVSYTLPGEARAPALAGIKLPIGSTLQTKKGSVTVVFADGSSMLLEADSELELDALSSFELNGMVDASVRLNKGTLKTRVIKGEPRSRFNTITPSAAAAVRGTEYLVNLVADPTTQQLATLVSVYQGLVEVGAQQKSYPVPADFGVVTQPGEAPQAPVKLLAAPSFSPLASTFLVEMDDTDLQTEAVTIDWQDLPGAAAYQLKVLAELTKADEALDMQIQRYDTGPSHADINGLRTGCYRLRLRAIDQQGLHGQAVETPLCIDKRIAAPLPTIHTSETTDESSAIVEWPQVTGATSYRIETSEHETFTTLLDSYTSTETSAMLSHDKQIFWRVYALDDGARVSSASPTISWQPIAEEKPYWTLSLPIGLFLLGLILI